MSIKTYPILPELLAENGGKQIIAGIQLSYGSVSIILMVYIFVHLMSSKYKTSFYRLVQADLLINIICWLNSWIAIRFMELEVGLLFIKLLENFYAGSWNISAFFTLVFFHLQFCSAASMSTHRISSIKYFNSYEKFWSRFYLLVEVIFIIYSLLTQVAGHPGKLEVINGTVWIHMNMEIWAANGRRLATFPCFYFCTLCILGITVARTTLKKLQGTSYQGVSRKMTKIAVAYGLVYSGILLWSISYMILTVLSAIPEFVREMGNTPLTLASDMMTLSLPYILLIFDTNLKNDIINSFHSPRSSSVIAVSE